jgi:hypothetical protein
MIANPRFDAGRFRAPADDAMGVLLELQRCKLRREEAFIDAQWF